MNHRAKCKTQNSKTLEYNNGENVDNLGCGNGFLDTKPKVLSIKQTVDKSGLY